MEKQSTIDINTKVYNETTLPVVKRKLKSRKPGTKTKSQRRDKSDLGENFIAPDGGWAWLVCVAAGISNLCVFPLLQQFGFIFRERLEFLGLTSSQITTIINTQPAISACTGLLNGPMFRRFTFRQVGLTGSMFIFSGIFLTAFCDTFLSYMVTYALLFGFGMGISVSASSLAINTYFKNKRRQAAGFSWTITGLGPIFLPYFVTAVLAIYGVQGTVMLFAAISLHSFVCALIYQPVSHHAPTACTALMGGENEVNLDPEPEYLCKFCEMNRRKNTGIFSSQYLYANDDADKPGFEITDPGTPMLSRANDGWFGSKLSLSSGKHSMRFRTVSISCKDTDGGYKIKPTILEEDLKMNGGEFFKPNNFSRERDEAMKKSSSRGDLRANNTTTSTYGLPYYSQEMRCTCVEDKGLLQLRTKDKTVLNNAADWQAKDLCTDYNQQEVSFVRKVVMFFDLELLRDFTFVNLVLGLTIINFSELNFSILTPFILNDFGFDTPQISLAMSVLGIMDILVRFLVPFCTEKIKWDNRVFFLIGVLGIALGRTVVAGSPSYPVILICFVWIGMCKGLRTIFWPLIIPGYVPLKRLPAASGLQLLISGIFTLASGPIVGLVRDRYDYSVTLHCLNSLTFIAATSWSLEAFVRNLHRKQKERDCVQT